MSIQEISKEEFDSLNIDSMGFFPEKAWFRSSEIDLAGTVIRDPWDKDWSYVVLAKDEDHIYRCIKSDVSLPNQAHAEDQILSLMSEMESKGSFEENFYIESREIITDDAINVVTSIDDQIKIYLKKNPEKMYDLTPRKFEELVASILKDMGFDVELTKATRDGGRDIIAYVRNSVSSYLTHIECKKYAPDNKVGVGIIREVLGVHNLRQATKSIIVTTSFFSRDAIKEAEMAKNHLDLKDFNDLKSWLQQY
ncbi:TPA: restriction endonuclease [Vibrio cholerae]|nr:restriction endonuclease [Vibrio cholerae]HDI3276000.1 restriction endonuclease [Vibrio cholerae]